MVGEVTYAGSRPWTAHSPTTGLLAKRSELKSIFFTGIPSVIIGKLLSFT